MRSYRLHVYQPTSGSSGYVAIEGHDFMDAIAMYLHPSHHKDHVIMSGEAVDSAVKSPITQEIDLRVQHQIERRKLWSAVYTATFALKYTGHRGWADNAVIDFDKSFPVIHAQ